MYTVTGPSPSRPWMSSQVSASTSPMRAPVASSTSKMRSRSYPRAGPRFDRPLCHAAILRRISTASSGVGARGLVADRGGVYAGVDGGVAERRYRFDPLCGEFTQSDGPQGWDEQLADYPGVGVERVLGFARPGAVGVGRSSVGPVRVAGRRRLHGQRDMMFVHQRWRTVLCFLDGEASLQCQRCRLCWSDPQNQMRCLSR